MELFKRNKAATAVLTVLACVGVGAWIYQLMGGLAVTGMSNGVSWGADRKSTRLNSSH